ncbi:MAG: Translation initiation factor 3 subunit J component [Alyxoria varia]|nr:MAG: Translation initiation factor 3 subunit J component [Alyxoria varia]
MAPSQWDDDGSDSTSATSPPPVAPVRRGKFDDEEDDSDVLDSWENAEDSEVEREKAKKAAEAKAKAEAEARANKKTKAQRVEEKRNERLRQKQLEEEDDSSDESEDEATKRQRMRAMEQEADMKNAEDLFGGGASGSHMNGRTANKTITISNPEDPAQTINLASLKIFDPQGRDQFAKLRETLVPLLAANSKKAQYPMFLQDFTKQISKELNSEQIKKVASTLTSLSNEKLKEEKAAEKGGKKTKAAKSKTTLNANRDTAMKADLHSYDDGGLDE